MPDIVARYLARTVAPQDAFQMPASFERDDLGPRPDPDRRILLDPANEVSRHVRRETVCADEHVNLPTRASEKYRGLTRRVGTSDDDDLVIVAKLRLLHEGCGVVNAGAFELRKISERWLTVSRSSRDDHGAGAYCRPIVQSHAELLPFAGEFRGAFCDHDGGTELLHLGI